MYSMYSFPQISSASNTILNFSPISDKEYYKNAKAPDSFALPGAVFLYLLIIFCHPLEFIIFYNSSSSSSHILTLV